VDIEVYHAATYSLLGFGYNGVSVHVWGSSGIKVNICNLLQSQARTCCWLVWCSC